MAGRRADQRRDGGLSGSVAPQAKRRWPQPPRLSFTSADMRLLDRLEDEALVKLCRAEAIVSPFELMRPERIVEAADVVALELPESAVRETPDAEAPS